VNLRAALVVCCLLGLGFMPRLSQAADLPTLMVWDLESQSGIDPGTVALLHELLLTELGLSGVYKVTGGSEIDALLSLEEQKSLVGCSSDECLAEIIGATGAEFLVTSSMGHLGDDYVFNIKILNARSGEVVARWSEQVGGTTEDLAEAIREGVHEVTTPREEITLERLAPWGLGAISTLTLGSGIYFGLRAKDYARRVNEAEFRVTKKIRGKARARQWVSNISYGIAALSGAAAAYFGWEQRVSADLTVGWVPTADGWHVSVGGALP